MSAVLTHVDLFSGIGGFALPARWAGFRTIAFCEIEEYCRRVLARHWPGVPIHEDVRTFNATGLRGGVDVLTGGFPCQDISAAGLGEGIEGSRSSLVFELLRVVRECEPRFVLLENSDRLRTRGADRVLSELESYGYACGSFVVGAGNAGAPHQRKRAIVVAHAKDQPGNKARSSNVSQRNGWQTPPLSGGMARDASGSGWDDPQVEGMPFGGWREAGATPCASNPWRIHQPPVPGVDAGLPHRVDRARALGNAVCPQVVLPFFNWIRDELLTEVTN